MKRRIYWLMPDVASARRTMHDLMRAEVEAAHIHVAGREDLDMTGLHAASVWQTSDLVHAAETGLVIGGVLGIVAGLATALLFPILGDGPQWEAFAVLATLGGVIGVWSSTMVGISIPSPRLQRFERPIEEGQILLMVDVPRTRVREIEDLLRRLHPEAHFEGEEGHMPAFP